MTGPTGGGDGPAPAGKDPRVPAPPDRHRVGPDLAPPGVPPAPAPPRAGEPLTVVRAMLFLPWCDISALLPCVCLCLCVFVCVCPCPCVHVPACVRAPRRRRPGAALPAPQTKRDRQGKKRSGVARFDPAAPAALRRPGGGAVKVVCPPPRGEVAPRRSLRPSLASSRFPACSRSPAPLSGTGLLRASGAGMGRDGTGRTRRDGMGPPPSQRGLGQGGSTPRYPARGSGSRAAAPSTPSPVPGRQQGREEGGRRALTCGQPSGSSPGDGGAAAGPGSASGSRSGLRRCPPEGVPGPEAPNEGKSSVLLSKASSTLQNIPPRFCRGRGLPAPSPAKQAGSAASSRRPDMGSGRGWGV